MKKKLLIPICLLLVLSMAGCCRDNPETEPQQPAAKVSAASENDTEDAEMLGKSKIEDRHFKPAAEEKPEKQEHREEPATAPKPTETVKPELTPNLTPTPIPTPTPELEIDIGYWVVYAKNYAVSVGLTLDSGATDCWDNPITANSKCRYLERDIQDILNRYSRDEDITDVWIWSESLGNGNYNIYIGYAWRARKNAWGKTATALPQAFLCQSVLSQLGFCGVNELFVCVIVFGENAEFLCQSGYVVRNVVCPRGLFLNSFRILVLAK